MPLGEYYSTTRTESSLTCCAMAPQRHHCAAASLCSGIAVQRAWNSRAEEMCSPQTSVSANRTTTTRWRTHSVSREFYSLIRTPTSFGSRGIGENCPHSPKPGQSSATCPVWRLQSDLGKVVLGRGVLGRASSFFRGGPVARQTDSPAGRAGRGLGASTVSLPN